MANLGFRGVLIADRYCEASEMVAGNVPRRARGYRELLQCSPRWDQARQLYEAATGLTPTTRAFQIALMKVAACPVVSREQADR